VQFINPKGETTEVVRWGEPLEAKLSYTADTRIEDPVFGFAVSDENGRRLHGNNTQIEQFRIDAIEDEGAIRLHIDHLPLAKGNYLFSFSLHSADHKTNYHRLDNCFPIAVQSDKPFEGYFFMPSRWSME